MAQKSLLRKFEHSCWRLWSQGIRKCSTEPLQKDVTKQINNPKYVNEVRLLGYVGQQPKQYELPDRFIVHFSMATNRYFLDKSVPDIKHQYTTWHSILVKYTNLQNYVMKYVTKGSRVYISGYLDDRNFDVTEMQSRGPVHIVAQEVIHLKKPRTHEDENSPFFIPLNEKLDS